MKHRDNEGPGDAARIGRRSVLQSVAITAAMAVSGGLSVPAAAQVSASTTAVKVSGRRKLGQLEVSSLGLGVHEAGQVGQVRLARVRTKPEPGQRVDRRHHPTRFSLPVRLA